VADVYRGALNCDEATLLEIQGQLLTGQPIVGYMHVIAAPR
jgi:hypothetical protein